MSFFSAQKIIDSIKLHERIFWSSLILVVILSGAIFLFLSASKKPEIKILEMSENLGEEKNPTPKILVDVSGSVKNPGLYDLDETSRIRDAIEAAGGLGEDADREQIEKNINLAERIIDGQKIYLPKISDSQTNENLEPENSNSENKLININSSSAEELDSLPGIGEKRSQAIIENRPYQKIEDLISRGIIPQYVYEDIKDKIKI